MSAFVQAFAILLREGIEALLVVAALGAYFTSTGQSQRIKSLYAGAGLAVVASLIAAWIFVAFNNGIHDDLTEGIVMLLAAALMLYVSGWLFLRQDPRAWQHYLKNKVDQAATGSSELAAATVAFLAVFREGAETILFIQALALSEKGWSAGLIAGLLAAAVLLALLFFFINVLARRLPLRAVFLFTSAVLFVMAIKFIGQAIQEFQEQLIVSYTPVPAGTTLMTALGLNPTVEALAAQGAVILVTILTVATVSRRASRGQSAVAGRTEA